MIQKLCQFSRIRRGRRIIQFAGRVKSNACFGCIGNHETHFRLFGQLHELFELAAIITYYKGGVRADGAEIVPNDAQEIMDLLKQLWATGDTAKVTEGVLGATFIWGEDLNLIPGLAEAVKKNLDSIQEKGMLETVKAIL